MQALRFLGIAREPKTSGLLYHRQAMGHAMLFQALAGPLHFHQLVGADGYQLYPGRRVLMQAQGALVRQFPGLLFTELRGLGIFRHHQNGDLPPAAVDFQECLHCAARVHRKQHRRHILHFRQPGFAQGWVLVGLLILAVFPGVRTQQNRHADPVGASVGMAALSREENFLAHGAEHFHRKGLVAGNQIEPLLVGQGGTYHRFFIEGGDHRTMQGFGNALLRIGDPMLQQVQAFIETVAAHLVRVANPHP